MENIQNSNYNGDISNSKFCCFHRNALTELMSHETNLKGLYSCTFPKDCVTHSYESLSLFNFESQCQEPIDSETTLMTTLDAKEDTISTNKHSESTTPLVKSDYIHPFSLDTEHTEATSSDGDDHKKLSGTGSTNDAIHIHKKSKCSCMQLFKRYKIQFLVAINAFVLVQALIQIPLVILALNMSMQCQCNSNVSNAIQAQGNSCDTNQSDLAGYVGHQGNKLGISSMLYYTLVSRVINTK